MQAVVQSVITHFVGEGWSVAIKPAIITLKKEDGSLYLCYKSGGGNNNANGRIEGVLAREDGGYELYLAPEEDETTKSNAFKIDKEMQLFEIQENNGKPNTGGNRKISLDINLRDLRGMTKSDVQIQIDHYNGLQERGELEPTKPPIRPKKYSL